MGWSTTSYRFILLPTLAGLVCYACTRSPKSQTADNKSSGQSAIVEPVANSSQIAAEPAPSPNAADSALYQESINLASSAYQLSQSAISPDDWSLVASRWERAISHLEQISPSSQHHSIAQAKTEEYARNAEHAAAQVQELKAFAKVAAVPTTPQRAVKSPIRLLQPTASTSSEVAIARKVVPIVRRLHGTPVVRVTFNNAKTYDMILDTGASRTLITRAMANDLQVVSTERMIASTASEAEVVFELGQVESMSMGGITLSNVRVSIGDSIDVGLLGNDFLNGYDITIKSRESIVELIRS